VVSSDAMIYFVQKKGCKNGVQRSRPLAVLHLAGPCRRTTSQLHGAYSSIVQFLAGLWCLDGERGEELDERRARDTASVAQVDDQGKVAVVNSDTRNVNDARDALLGLFRKLHVD